MDYNSDQQNTNQEPQLDGSENLRQLLAYYQQKGRQRPDGATQPKGGTYQWFLLVGLIIIALGLWFSQTDAYQGFLDELNQATSQQDTPQPSLSQENSQDIDELDRLFEEMTPEQRVIADMAGLTFDIIWYHLEEDVALLSEENIEIVYGSAAYDSYIHPITESNYTLTTTEDPDEGVLHLKKGYCPDEASVSDAEYIHAITKLPDGEQYCFPRQRFDSAELDF